jgi:hypothetical protein
LTEFSTPDYGAAAALQMHGFQCLRLDTVGRQHRFVFVDSPEVRDIVFRYQAGQLTGNLLAFRATFSQITQHIKVSRQEPRQ